MRDLINLIEAVGKSGYQIGDLSQTQIFHDGELGDLEDAISLWVQGECTEATPYLLSLNHIAAEYAPKHPLVLYRGLVLDSEEAARDALENGIEIVRRRTLESWSTRAEAVYDFMDGFPEHWIMIKRKFNPDEMYIDLVDFDTRAQPFTQTHGQDEIITYVADKMFYLPNQIIIPEGDSESLNGF